nr:DUF2202 domain-containing protein [Corynebacterium lactis]
MASKTFVRSAWRRRPAAATTIAILGVLALGLSGCGNADQTAATPSSSSTASQAQAEASTGASGSASAPATTATADQQVAQDLEFTLQEERMARDLYQALGDKWGTRPFTNIVNAEQRHMDLVVAQLERLGLPTTSKDGTAGQFANAEIQKLYDGWLSRGMTSQAEALSVGAELERRDIDDLEKIIQATSDQELKDMYGYLLQGSRNHLRAFENGGGGCMTGRPGTPGTPGSGPGSMNGRGGGPGGPGGGTGGGPGTNPDCPMNAQ